MLPWPLGSCLLFRQPKRDRDRRVDVPSPFVVTLDVVLGEHDPANLPAFTIDDEVVLQPIAADHGRAEGEVVLHVVPLKIRMLAGKSYIRCMITIDTSKFEAKHGKPKGKRYWRFMIVSRSVTAKDKYFQVDQPMTFQAACDRAKELRRSERIVVEPD
jgi:hypothetical protein